MLSATAACSLILLHPGAEQGRTNEVALRVLPARVHVVERSAQHLNFDLLLSNRTADTLEVDRLTLQVFDSGGRLALEQYAAGNGGGTERLFFNPFAALERTVPLTRLCFHVTLLRRGSAEPVTVGAEVSPVRFRQAARLRLPLPRRALVPNGGDFLSHHRRLDYTQPLARQLALSSNFERFALDFVVVDSLGRKFRGRGTRNEDWFGYGTPVLAPAGGVVAASHDGQVDNDEIGSENRFDPSAVLRDPMLLYGNYVLIDHGQGEFSILGHLRNGSVAVRPGARVESGALVGRVGSSGSSLEPHLHYELRTGPGLRGVEGLPAHFDRFRRVYGALTTRERRGVVDSGDIVEPY